MRKLVRSRVGAVAAGATIIAVVGAGGAVAAGKITGDDIKDGTVTGADIRADSVHGSKLKDGSVGYDKLKDGTKDKLRGEPGPAGPPGEPGAPGLSLVANETTAANATYGGVRVVDVPSVAASSGGPGATEGAELVGPIELEEGTYLVQSTVQFFDFQPSATNDVDYGVARIFLDGESLGTSWSPQVPDDGNNAAQAAGTIVVTVPEGGGTLTARAVLRGGDAGQAGGNLIVNQVQAAE